MAGDDVINILREEGLDLRNGVHPYDVRQIESKIDELFDRETEEKVSTTESETQAHVLEALSKEIKRRLEAWAVKHELSRERVAELHEILEKAVEEIA